MVVTQLGWGLHNHRFKGEGVPISSWINLSVKDLNKQPYLISLLYLRHKHVFEVFLSGPAEYVKSFYY